MSLVSRSLFAAVFGCLVVTACSGQDGSSTSSSGELRATEDGGAKAQNGMKARYCGASPCACANGVDDDGDGKADAEDVECQGDMDNDEATFATGMPGDNRDPKWQDCFFDGNSGAGDDRCRYPTGCLTGEIAQTDRACAITQSCLDRCMPFVPQGCDCFGCCTVSTGSGPVDIQLSKSCTGAKLGNPKACARCEKSTTCHPPAVDAGSPPPAVDAGSPPPPPPPDSGAPPPNPCGDAEECMTAESCNAGYQCTAGCCVSIPE
ncbi:MAG TPA: hypothetical protein VI072_11910 [Polyangiaceae bacterium]